MNSPVVRSPATIAILLASLVIGPGCGESSGDESSGDPEGPESSFFPEESSGGDPGLLTIQVSMSPAKPNGGDWDAFGGAPDPYVKVGGISFRAEGCNDTLFCSFQVSGTGPFAVEVYDADVSEDDYAGSVKCSAGTTCTTNNGGAEVTVK